MRFLKLYILILLFINFMPARETKNSGFFNQSGQVKIGFFIGGNASGIYGAYVKNEIFKAGLSSGISLVKKLDDNFHFRTGLYYISKGYKTRKIKSEDYIDKKERYYLITDYLEIPLLMQFYGTVLDFNTNWMVGIGSAFNINKKSKTKVDDKVFYSSVNNIRILDFTFIVGANFMVTDHLNFDLRADAGLIPYSKISDFLGKRNISLVFQLGYFL